MRSALPTMSLCQMCRRFDVQSFGTQEQTQRRSISCFSVVDGAKKDCNFCFFLLRAFCLHDRSFATRAVLRDWFHIDPVWNSGICALNVPSNTAGLGLRALKFTLSNKEISASILVHITGDTGMINFGFVPQRKLFTS
jgi:hypothetical protein